VSAIFSPEDAIPHHLDETPVSSEPSRVPLLLAFAGLGAAIWGCFSPWYYRYGTRALDGFDGGWMTTHLRGRFGEWDWAHGADAWLVVLIALAAVAVAAANRRYRDQRLDRVQFFCGAALVAIVAYNWSWIMRFAGGHIISDCRPSGSDCMDGPGYGLALLLLSAALTSAGALLGNTPEFPFTGGASPSQPAPNRAP
jgi:hypothetical protein